MYFTHSKNSRIVYIYFECSQKDRSPNGMMVIYREIGMVELYEHMWPTDSPMPLPVHKWLFRQFHFKA